MDEDNLIYLFHHIHHRDGDHEIHHCGGEHQQIDSEMRYEICHCRCGQHRIDKKVAVSHTVDKNLNSQIVRVEFFEECPEGGWHVESGTPV